MTAGWIKHVLYVWIVLKMGIIQDINMLPKQQEVDAVIVVIFKLGVRKVSVKHIQENLKISKLIAK